MKSRALFLFGIFASAAFAQFQNLATTDDGSVLLFSTSLITPGSNQPAWEKLFRINASGLSLYAERDQTTAPGAILTNHYRMLGPVSPPVADGAAPRVNPPAAVVAQPARHLANFTPDAAQSAVRRDATQGRGVLPACTATAAAGAGLVRRSTARMFDRPVLRG